MFIEINKFSQIIITCNVAYFIKTAVISSCLFFFADVKKKDPENVFTTSMWLQFSLSTLFRFGFCRFGITFLFAEISVRSYYFFSKQTKWKSKR